MSEEKPDPVTLAQDGDYRSASARGRRRSRAHRRIGAAGPGAAGPIRRECCWRSIANCMWPVCCSPCASKRTSPASWRGNHRDPAECGRTLAHSTGIRRAAPPRGRGDYERLDRVLEQFEQSARSPRVSARASMCRSRSRTSMATLCWATRILPSDHAMAGRLALRIRRAGSSRPLSRAIHGRRLSRQPGPCRRQRVQT